MLRMISQNSYHELNRMFFQNNIANGVMEIMDSEFFVLYNITLEENKFREGKNQNFEKLKVVFNKAYSIFKH